VGGRSGFDGVPAATADIDIDRDAAIVIDLEAETAGVLEVWTVVLDLGGYCRGRRREMTLTTAYSMREAKTNMRHMIIQTSIALM